MKNTIRGLALGMVLGGSGGFAIGDDLDTTMGGMASEQQEENSKIVKSVLVQTDYAKVEEDILLSLEGIYNPSEVPSAVTKVLTSHNIPLEQINRVETVLKIHTAYQRHPIPSGTIVATCVMTILMGLIGGIVGAASGARFD